MRRSPSAPSKLGPKPASPLAEKSSLLAAAGSGVVLPPAGVQVIVRTIPEQITNYEEGRWLDSLRKYPALPGNPHAFPADGTSGLAASSSGGEGDAFVTELPEDEDEIGSPSPGQISEAAQVSPQSAECFRLLTSIGSDTCQQNRKHAEIAASPLWKEHREKAAAYPKVHGEEEMERRMLNISSSIDRIRRQHESFVPGETLQGPGGTRAKSNLINGYTLEEFQERLEQLKYVRKIEPELPPLVRSPQETKEPPKTSATVRWNCTPAALKSQEPKERRKAMRSRSEIEKSKAISVVEQRELLFEEKMARRREQVAHGECKGVTHSENSQTGRKAQVTMLMKAMACAGFIVRIRDELKLGKMRFKDRMKLVTSDSSALSVSMRKSAYVHQAMEIQEGLDDPLFLQYKELFRCVFSKKLKVKVARQDCRKIVTCLTGWRVFGQVAVHMMRVRNAIHRIQKFWRWCSAKLNRILEKVARELRVIEKQVLLEELREEEKADRRAANRPKRGTLGTIEGRLKLRLLDEKVRTKFLIYELRSRRFRLLSALVQFDEECARWREDMKRVAETAKQQRKAHKQMKTQLKRAAASVSDKKKPVVKAEETDSEDAMDDAEEEEAAKEERQKRAMLFRWPPMFPPTYYPTKEDMLDMLERVRADPRGWLPVPQVAGKDAKKESKRGKPRGGAVSRLDTPTVEKPNRSLDLSDDDVSNVASVRRRRRGNMRGGRSTQEFGAEEAVAEEDSAKEEEDTCDEDLHKLGMRPSTMPGGIAKHPSHFEPLII